MDEEKRNALRRLVARLHDQVYFLDPRKEREGFWSLYLLWLLHEQTTPQRRQEIRLERKRAVDDLDRIYSRRVACDDLVEIARMHGCDLFDVVLLMPTVTGDLNELRVMPEP